MVFRLQRKIVVGLVLFMLSSSLIGQKNDPGFSYMSEQLEKKSTPCYDEDDRQKMQVFTPQFKGTLKVKDSLSKLYQKALEGNPEAQYQIGTIFLKGEFVDKSFQHGASWFGKAAGQKHRRAAYDLGLLFESDYLHDRMLMSRFFKLGLKENAGSRIDFIYLMGNYFEKIKRYDFSSVYYQTLISPNE